MKECRLSNVTPNTLGVSTVGILMSSTKILRSSLYSFVQLENMVPVDLAGESAKVLAVKKRERSWR